MLTTLLTKLAALVQRHPVAILLVALGLTILSAGYATGLSIKTDIGDLLPEHTFSVTHLKEVGKRIGAAGNLMVMVQGEHPDEMKRFAKDFAGALMTAKQHRKQQGQEALVQKVDYRNDIQYFEDHSLYWLSVSELQDLWQDIDDEIRKRKLDANPLYVDLIGEEDSAPDPSGDNAWSFDTLQQKYNTGDFKEYFISDDETVLAILVRPTGPSSDLAFAKRLLLHVREVGNRVLEADHYQSVSFDLGGSYRNKMVEKQSIINDIIRSFGSTFILLALTLLVYFRRFRAILVILTPLVCGVIWSFALAELQYGYLNMITAFIFAVLLGLGIDFGIHYLNRYQEIRLGGGSIHDALVEAQTKTGRAIITGSVTTSAAFFALMLADFRGFSQFGFIAGSGVLLCLIATLTVHPALLVVSEKLIPIVKRDSAPKPLNPIPVPRPGVIVLATLALTLAGGYTMIQSVLAHDNPAWHSDTQRCAPGDATCSEPLIDIEFNFAKLRTRDNPILNMSKIYGKAMPLSLQPAIVIADDLADAKRLHRRVMDMKSENEHSTIKIVRSLKTFLPSKMQRKQKLIRAIGRLLTDANLDLLDDPQKRRDAERLQKITTHSPVTLFDLPEKIIRTFSIVKPGKEDVIPVLKRVMTGWDGLSLDDAFRTELQTRWPTLTHDQKTILREAFTPGDTKAPSPLLSDTQLLDELANWVKRNVGVLAMVYTNVDTWNGIASIRFAKETATITDGAKTYRPAGETYIFADTLWAMERDGARAVGAALLIVFVILWVDLRSLRQTLMVISPLFLGVAFLAVIMALTGIKLNFFNMVVLPTLIGISVDNGVHLFHRYREEGKGSSPVVLATSGWAVTLASLTTMMGFGGMVTANHAGLSSLGELAIVGISCCLVASVVAFPALLQFVENRKR